MNDSLSTPFAWLKRVYYRLKNFPYNRESLLQLLIQAETLHVLDSDSLSMIEGILQISEMQVRDIMLPRAQMVTLYEYQTTEEMIQTIAQSGHSRFPIIGQHRDKVIGILLAKDLLHYSSKKQPPLFEIEDILRPPIFVPESKRLDILLREFRKNHHHIAIVIDEYGNTAGLITIEDILEQIVGEIEDEYDIDEEDTIKKHSDKEYIIKAFTSIEDFNEHFKTSYSDKEFDTIGGLVTHHFGRLPKRNETINIDEFKFTILNADSRRIHLFRMTILR